MRIDIPEKIVLDKHVVKNVKLNIPNQYQGRLKCTVERDDGDKDVDIACTQFECKGLDVKSMTWKATAACIDMLTKSPIQINFKYLKLKEMEDRYNKRWKNRDDTSLWIRSSNRDNQNTLTHKEDKGMRKFVKKELGIIKKLAETEIPAMVNKGCTDVEYRQKRAELNVHVIQACVGGEMVEGKKNNKFKFNHHLPNMSQVAEMAAIMTAFADAECSFFDTDPDDDMGIPEGLVKPDKTRNKNLKASILGDGCKAIYNLPLNGVDVCTLAAMGSEARKAHNRTVAIIIGGAVVAVGVVAGVGCVLYKKKHHHSDADTDVDDIDIDVDIDADDIDIDNVDVDDDTDIDIDAVDIEE